MFSQVISSFLLSTLLLIMISEQVQSRTGPSHDKVVVCYISTWAVYRPNSGSYSLDDFQPNLCTHAIYAFAGLDTELDAVKSLDPWQDLKDNYGKGGFEKLTNYKKSYPHLKVLLAIGGWNEGSANYSRMAASPERRQRFVKQAAQFVRTHNFDGLDLDWEYPAQRGGAPEDKQNFVLLVKELKEEFKPHNLLLTSAIGAGKNTIDAAYNIKQLAKYLDFFHMMCYDYGGSWDKKVTPNAPLKSRDEGFLNVEYTINYVMSLGAPASKIVIGLPFYGRTFVTGKQGKLGDVANDVGFQGPFTRENGFMGYNEICDSVSASKSEWITTWDDLTSQAIATFNEVNSSKIVVYDSPRSIANKVRFAMRLNVAGAMIWSVDTDDFRGSCAFPTDTYDDFGDKPGIKLNIPTRTVRSYPLLNTVNEAMVIALDEIKQEQDIDKQNEIVPVEPNSANNIYHIDKLLWVAVIVVAALYNNILT